MTENQKRRCVLSLLRSLPLPTIIEEIDYEKIVERKLERIKTLLSEKGVTYEPSEADDLMTLIEADAYDEMLLRASLNARIRQLFLAYATGSNLDHIGTTRFGIERLEGKKPTATVRFSLSAPQTSDTIIPSGLMLGDGDQTSHLLAPVIIKSGEISADGVAVLDRYVRESATNTETILTPVPWVVSVSQVTSFSGGAEHEEDDRYRERIWLGRERKSTAGSEASYIYYAKSADVRVKEVAVQNGGGGIVNVAVIGEDFITPADMIAQVANALNGEQVRPLSDTVNVFSAGIIDVQIQATLYADNIELVDIETIRKRFAEYEGVFGAKLTVPKIYDLLGDKHIVDITLDAPVSSIAAEWNEVLRFGYQLHVEAAQ